MTEMYEPTLECVVMHQTLVEANVTCEKLCRKI